MAFNLMESRRRILLNTPHIETASGDVATFTTDMAAPLKSCIVTINPVQEGTGDPSPENVRPISGWTGCHIGLPDAYQEVEYVDNQGGGVINTNVLRAENIELFLKYRPVTSGSFYGMVSRSSATAAIFGLTGSQTGDTLNFRYGGNYTGQKIFREIGHVYTQRGVVYNGVGTHYIVDETAGISETGTFIASLTQSIVPFYLSRAQSGVYGIRACYYSAYIRVEGELVRYYVPCYRKSDNKAGMYDLVNDIFHPSIGSADFTAGPNISSSAVSVSWETEAGTVYGGTLDALTGLLTVRPYYASYNGETLVGPWISSMDVYAPGTTPTTGAQVVDLGGAITTYQLDPVTLTTLRGRNNIRADCGQVEVKFWKH